MIAPTKKNEHWKKQIMGDKLLRCVDDNTFYSPTRDLFYSDVVNNHGGSKPLSICVKLLAKCNLKCSVCIASNGNEDNSFSLNEIYRILEGLSSYSPMRLVWSGGEPTIHPQIQEIVESALNLGFFNVVSSNMTCGDPLRLICRSFAYEISIYATDRPAYREYTGRDLYNKFVQDFKTLFADRHIVSAGIRVDQEWRAHLPPLLDWLRNYPICKLRLSNTLPRGRNIGNAKPLNDRELSWVREFISRLSLPFPVIVPSVETSKNINKGYIVIEPSKDKTAIAQVNGNPVECVNALRTAIAKVSANNRRLFTMQNYL